MEFISKYNMTFIRYVNKKYNKRFKSFDDYGLYLWDKHYNKTHEYYYALEADLKEYCEFQEERKYNYGKNKGYTK